MQHSTEPKGGMGKEADGGHFQFKDTFPLPALEKTAEKRKMLFCFTAFILLTFTCYVIDSLTDSTILCVLTQK